MANSDGTSWDEGVPIISNPRRNGALEILSLRQGVNVRARKEHRGYAAASVGGEHLMGSAIAYYQATKPTTKPDGVTALDVNDNGRIWINSTNQAISIWNNTNADWILQTTSAQSFDVPGGPLTGETWTCNTGFPISAPSGSPNIIVNGLKPGKWLVIVTGELNGNSIGTAFLTINGITRSFVRAFNTGGSMTFSMTFRVVVTGSPTGSITITSLSVDPDVYIYGLESFTGVFLG